MMPVETPQLTQFASDVASGLAHPLQKELPSTWLYDELGSILFEAITRLPEYGLTRADERILRRCGPALAARLPGNTILAELGSGTGRKTLHLLEAWRGTPAKYFPIDVSASALQACVHELGGVAEVHPLESSYLDGLARVAQMRRAGQPLLVLFLGSTIGNFDARAAEDFLRDLRGLLLPGDFLLLGADLVKAPEVMIAAYDDALGVTAAFNLNLLVRMNRELGADFHVERFAHEARWNAQERRIEMHLRSLRQQCVSLEALDLRVRFEQGETIWTESSHKFRLEELATLAYVTGYSPRQQWLDSPWPFAECLWQAAER